MASTPHIVKVQLDTTALDKITAIYHDALNELADARSDLIILTAYMARHNYEGEVIAYAVEKPHKFTDVLAKAKAALEAEAKP